MPVEHGNGGTVITGKAIVGYQALSLVHGLRLYLKTGLKATRQYTPTNMVASAKLFTGKSYPRTKKGMTEALADLEALMAEKSLDEVGAIPK